MICKGDIGFARTGRGKVACIGSAGAGKVSCDSTIIGGFDRAARLTRLGRFRRINISRKGSVLAGKDGCYGGITGGRDVTHHGSVLAGEGGRYGRLVRGIASSPLVTRRCRIDISCKGNIFTGEGGCYGGIIGGRDVTHHGSILSGEGGIDGCSIARLHIPGHLGISALEVCQNFSLFTRRRHVAFKEGLVPGKINIGRTVAGSDCTRDFYDARGPFIDFNEPFPSLDA